MGLYKNNNGTLVPIAGRGKAEYGASTVRTGTITITVESKSTAFGQVTFSEPMPDSDYLIELDGRYGDAIPFIVNRADKPKTANGFYICAYNNAPSQQNIPVTYTAFKLYTDTEYNGLLTDVAELTKREIYSTTPQIVGTWIDGRRVYQAVIQNLTLPNGSTAAPAVTPHGLTCDLIISYSFWTYVNDTIVVIPNSNIANNVIDGFVDKTAIYIRSSSGYDPSATYSNTFAVIRYV